MRNNLNTIINSLSKSSTLDNYQLLILDELNKVNELNSNFDRYLFENRNSIFLDNEGNFYSDVSFKEKLGNIVTDNIEITLARYVEDKYKDD